MKRTLQEITVEVIQKCNSNCIYCSSLSKFNSSDENEIPLAEFKELVLFAKEKNAESINISGGEPLLKEDLPDLIAFCSQNGLKANVYTSGNINIDGFINKISSIDKTLIKLIFNYQSSDANIFNRLVNCSDFGLETVNKNIQTCISQGYDVEVHLVPNALNLGTIYQTCKNLKSMGVKQVSLLKMVFQGRAKNNKDLLEIKKTSDLEEIIEKIHTNICDSDFTLRCGIPFNKLAKQDLSCVAGYQKLIIRYDGIVFPCEAFKEAPNNHKYILGNIYKNTLIEIWDKYHIMDELKKLKSHSNASCESCPAQLLYK